MLTQRSICADFVSPKEDFTFKTKNLPGICKFLARGHVSLQCEVSKYARKLCILTKQEHKVTSLERKLVDKVELQSNKQFFFSGIAATLQNT